MGNKTTTLATFRATVRTIVSDTSSERWTDAEVNASVNAGLRACPVQETVVETIIPDPRSGLYDYVAITTPNVVGVDAVYVALGVKDSVQFPLEPLPPDEYSVAWSADGTYVVGIRIPPSPSSCRVHVVLRKATRELVSDTDKSPLDVEFVVHYAAAVLWSVRAARAELVEARFCHTQAQWQMAIAQARGQYLMGRRAKEE